MKSYKIFLLTAAFVLTLGGVSFAKEKQDHPGSRVEISQADLNIALMPAATLVKSYRVESNGIYFHVIEFVNHTEARAIGPVELRDPGLAMAHDYDKTYKPTPSPKVRQMKAKALIRGVLKHPKGSN